MCRKLILCGWVVLIPDDAQQARVLAALVVSISFLVLRLSLKPLKRPEDAALATMSEVALILVYLCALVIKACDLSADVCSTYGFGDDSKGVFLFFLFFGLSVLLLQLILEVAALVYGSRQQRKLRRLRHRGGGFVELPPLTENDFAHLPGLEPSPCYHLFLSHAWPLGQDVCKLIKQRCREICPSMHIFLDVEDLTSGSGTKEVDHSRCILVFAMPVYFEKFNCVKELTRAILRNKQITLLLPDSEVHGVFTQAMVNDSVTDQWVQKWKLEKNLTEWASEWGVKEVNTPTASEIRNALFKQPPLEWSRITHFQDRTMVLMCQRLLPETERRDIYLQGTVSFKLPKGYVPSRVYCSPHNPGAREIAGELNAFVEANSRTNSRRISSFRSSRQTVVSRACGSRISRVTRRKTHGDGVSGRLLEVVEVGSWSDLGNCDHMLICLNAQTWSLEAETLAADIREAMREGLHLQLCHEFPSVLDPDTQRHAIEFKQIMDMTPVDLRKGQTNIYRQIAIPLKAGALREPGLAHLASRLARYAPRESVHLGDPAASQRSTRRLQKLRSKKDALSNRDVNVGAIQPEEMDAALDSNNPVMRAFSGFLGELERVASSLSLARSESQFSLGRRSTSQGSMDNATPAINAESGECSPLRRFSSSLSLRREESKSSVVDPATEEVNATAGSALTVQSSL